MHTYSKVSTATRLIMSALIASLATTGALRAQSDLDVVQAIAQKDLSKVTICLGRGTDPNITYGEDKKTALMLAIEEFEETLQAKEELEKTSVAKNIGQFFWGTGLFAGSLGVSGASGILIWGLNTPEIRDSRQEPSPSNGQVPTISISTAETAPSTGLFGGKVRAAFGTFTSLFRPPPTPAAQHSTNPVPPSPRSSSPSMPQAAPTPKAQINGNFVIPDSIAQKTNEALGTVQDTLGHYKDLADDGRGAVNNINSLVRIITMMVLAAAGCVGLVGAYRGAPQAINGLSKATSNPIKTFHNAYELRALKNIIYQLVRQEHVNLTTKNKNDETALDMVQDFMLKHIRNKYNYRYLAEIEQLIKIRQLAS